MLTFLKIPRDEILNFALVSLHIPRFATLGKSEVAPKFKFLSLSIDTVQEEF